MNEIVNQVERENSGKVVAFRPVVDHHLRVVLTGRKCRHYLTGAFLIAVGLLLAVLAAILIRRWSSR